jgi:hypothetical protein
MLRQSTGHFSIRAALSCSVALQAGGAAVVRLDHGAPAASQCVRNSTCDVFTSWYPNSVPQEGQISKEAQPVLS